MLCYKNPTEASTISRSARLHPLSLCVWSNDLTAGDNTFDLCGTVGNVCLEVLVAVGFPIANNSEAHHAAAQRPSQANSIASETGKATRTQHGASASPEIPLSVVSRVQPDPTETSAASPGPAQNDPESSSGFLAVSGAQGNRLPTRKNCVRALHRPRVAHCCVGFGVTYGYTDTVREVASLRCPSRLHPSGT
ncbi:hypothetical protein N658DRAFT_5898 [Parathielavia hyrcaniae]|uniref:Uncharacterized protein n=1 Tax=Parathielavia hyrcaniae TaxID=113614 RepID=A0AAN6Q9E1_9PEZI|nr:hypothetical protein N658DRAFT_5898 [Parathielavia hyrcaniae]